MKLKIRCDYKKQKLHVEFDPNHFQLFTLIFDAFNRPKKNRYWFLLGLGLLLALLLTTASMPDCYADKLYLPVIAPAVVLLASSICKQGPPILLNVKCPIIKLRSFKFMDHNKVICIDISKEKKTLNDEAERIICNMLIRLYMEQEESHGHSGNVA